MECVEMQATEISLVVRLGRIVQAACEPLPDLELRTLAESVNRDRGIPFPLFAEWGPIDGKTPLSPSSLFEPLPKS